MVDLRSGKFCARHPGPDAISRLPRPSGRVQLLPPLGEDESRPSADRIVCARCGEVGAEVLPDWDNR